MSNANYEATEWPTPGVQLKACPRCENGATETDHSGDITCLTCGYVKYLLEPELEGGTARASGVERKTHDRSKVKRKARAAIRNAS